MKTLSIVIPAYNEEKRISRTMNLLSQAIAEKVFNEFKLIEILVIDDGSTDKTVDLILEEMEQNQYLNLFSLKQNHGKGAAVRTGLILAKGAWVLVADADSATPWREIKKLEAAMTPIAIGSRFNGRVRTDRNNKVRKILGQFFNFLVRSISNLDINDTQCGFKLFNKKNSELFLNRLCVNRFAWDVEFLMYSNLYKLKISEIHVDWQDQPGSTVNPFKDSIEMFVRILEIRFMFLKNRMLHFFDRPFKATNRIEVIHHEIKTIQKAS